MQSNLTLPEELVASNAHFSSDDDGTLAPQNAGALAANARSIVRNNAAAVNRRTYARYSAVNDRLWIGWWAQDEFVLVQATLVNISEGGVLIGVNPSPAQGQFVWMRLQGSATRESLSAVVLESRWTLLKRRFAVRLAFLERCPSSFFESAFDGDESPLT